MSQEQSNESEDGFEKLSANLMSNFEEHWELQESIRELEELQRKNHDQLL